MIPPLVFYLLVITLSLIILVKSSDYLLQGVSRYARELGLSTYIIGILVVSLAASVPETISSLMGGSIGSSEIAFGTLVGTNVAHIFFVFGVLAIFGKKLNLKCEILHKSKLMIMFLAIAPFVLVFDGELSRLDGVILLALFGVYLFVLWRKEGSLGHLKKNVQLRNIWKDGLLFLMAFAALTLGARWLVTGVEELSGLIALSPLFLAAVVLAWGDSLSDLSVGIKSVQRKETKIGVGDILGSTMANFLFGLGLVSLIYPLKISFISLLPLTIFSLGGLGIFLLFIRKGSINWKYGVALLSAYFVFVIWQARWLMK